MSRQTSMAISLTPVPTLVETFFVSINNPSINISKGAPRARADRPLMEE